MSSRNTFTQQQWIAEQASLSLATGVHDPAPTCSTCDWLREAFQADAEGWGYDGSTAMIAADYERELKANLESLLGQIKSGHYAAPADFACTTSRKRKARGGLSASRFSRTRWRSGPT